MMALEALLKNTRINNIAFEFPGDLQEEFDEYFATRQRPAEMMKFAMAMIAHYPQAATLPRKKRQECARQIMNSEGIHSLIDVAWIAKRHYAKVLLVDTPMAEVKSGDPKIALRNKAMSRKLMRFSGGKTMILLVGNAHTGHGTLGVSLDDQLTQLGASTMSICISTNSIPMRKDWGTDNGTADYHLTKIADIVSLVMSRVSETRSPGQSDQLATSGTNAIVSGLPSAISRSASLSQR
jgi:hypothetical protein